GLRPILATRRQRSGRDRACARGDRRHRSSGAVARRRYGRFGTVRVGRGEAPRPTGSRAAVSIRSKTLPPFVPATTVPYGRTASERIRVFVSPSLDGAQLVPPSALSKIPALVPANTIPTRGSAAIALTVATTPAGVQVVPPSPLVKSP